MKMKKTLSMAVMVGIGYLVQVPAHATTFVLMDFDGDSLFPSLTWQNDTTGLAAFTGSAFGLSNAERDTVVTKVMALVQEDYAPYDIDFVTDTSGLSNWYTWGVDDSAYVFTTGQPSPPPGGHYAEIDPYQPCPDPTWNCSRLFGKAKNGPGDTDQYGNPIYHPTYARTFAGSMALGPNDASPSSPSLYGASVDQISQAIANSAAHEIAHLFGVGHPDPNNPGRGWNLMWTEVESVEANNNKYFSASDQAILMAALGQRCTTNCGGLPVPAPSSILLMGLGLISLALRRQRKV